VADEPQPKHCPPEARSYLAIVCAKARWNAWKPSTLEGVRSRR
jgi:hypothetical protein